MPKLAVLTYGFFGQQLASLTGKNPSVSYPMARISCDEHFYTAEKAIRELDLPQSPIEEGILECFNWMKSNGIA
jgi:dihydroflavonol-4-reductase